MKRLSMKATFMPSKRDEPCPFILMLKWQGLARSYRVLHCNFRSDFVIQFSIKTNDDQPIIMHKECYLWSYSDLKL